MVMMFCNGKGNATIHTDTTSSIDNTHDSLVHQQVFQYQPCSDFGPTRKGEEPHHFVEQAQGSAEMPYSAASSDGGIVGVQGWEG